MDDRLIITMSLVYFFGFNATFDVARIYKKNIITSLLIGVTWPVFVPSLLIVKIVLMFDSPTDRDYTR